MSISRRIAFSILALASLSQTPAPAAAAGKAESPAPAEVRRGPSSIELRPSLSPEDKTRRERDLEAHRRHVQSRLAAWIGPYEDALHPLRAALAEALRSLAISWGPTTRNAGYAVELAVTRFLNSPALPAPDPLIEAQLRRALSELAAGADACTRGLPTTAQLHLLAGKRWLERANRTIAGYRQGTPPRPLAGSRQRLLLP